MHQECCPQFHSRIHNGKEGNKDVFMISLSHPTMSFRLTGKPAGVAPGSVSPDWILSQLGAYVEVPLIMVTYTPDIKRKRLLVMFWTENWHTFQPLWGLSKDIKACNQTTLPLNLPTAKATPCFRAEAGEYVVQECNFTSL